MGGARRVPRLFSLATASSGPGGDYGAEGLALNTVYLESAKARIGNVPVLINLVSRRVRQLNSGQRPLVKPDFPHMERLDIALKEIAEGKLEAEIIAVEGAPSTTGEAFKRLFSD